MKKPSPPSTDSDARDTHRGRYGDALAALANVAGRHLRASAQPRLRDISRAKAEVLVSGDTARALRAWMRGSKSD